MARTKTPNPSIKVNEPTIDHFIPQNLDEWGIEADGAKDYIHKIGNLALLNRQLNQKLQNASLDKKISDVYASNEFDENSKVLVGMQENFRVDPEQAVLDRGKMLAGKAFNLLKLKKR